MGGYSAADRQRWVPEDHQPSLRSDFARDRARILHSAAWRRLAGRTQVVVAGSADFPRTRMTHSLECAQIGGELAESLGCDSDLVEAACLAHDLGHPPFGHTGEAALDGAAHAIGGFEGNAQTLRVLTRLEPKSFGIVAGRRRSVGLNLTRAALDATCKYPWPRGSVGGPAKFGAYRDDLDAFGFLRAGAPANTLCLEAQIMDWADDVAYSVHDVEDGIHACLIDLRELRDPHTIEIVAGVAHDVYARGVPTQDLVAAYDRLRPRLPFAFGGSQADLAALKNLTSSLIGRFTTAAEAATRAAHSAPELSRYDADLHVPAGTRHEVAVLKAIAYHFVMTRPAALRERAKHEELIGELVGLTFQNAPDCLAPQFQAQWRAAIDDGQALRVVVDHVATLTDASAAAAHKTLRRKGRKHA